MDSIQVRYGELIRGYGRPSMTEVYVFCPVDIDFLSEPAELHPYEFSLAEHAGCPSSPALRRAIRGGFDVAWTVSRILQVFFIELDASAWGTWGRVLDQGFVAVPEGGHIAYPFMCRDFAGRSHLQFSLEEPDEGACRRIAAEFWRRLLQAPDELMDFEIQVDNAMCEDNFEWPPDLEYGCKFGHLYREELRK